MQGSEFRVLQGLGFKVVRVMRETQGSGFRVFRLSVAGLCGKVFGTLEHSCSTVMP